MAYTWIPNRGKKPRFDLVDIRLKLANGNLVEHLQEYPNEWDWEQSVFGSTITHYRKNNDPIEPVTPRSESGSIIFNKTMNLSFTLDGAEVDLLALNLYGEKRVIDPADASAYLQGIFERTIVANVGVDHIKTKMEYALRSQGKTEKYIAGYLRGWNHVGTTLGQKGA